MWVLQARHEYKKLFSTLVEINFFIFLQLCLVFFSYRSFVFFIVWFVLFFRLTYYFFLHPHHFVFFDLTNETFSFYFTATFRIWINWKRDQRKYSHRKYKRLVHITYYVLFYYKGCTKWSQIKHNLRAKFHLEICLRENLLGAFLSERVSPKSDILGTNKRKLSSKHSVSECKRGVWRVKVEWSPIQTELKNWLLSIN